MKIAVTGGAGFIGSHIVDAYIAEGHDVVVIDNLSSGNKSMVNPKATLYTMDIADPKIADVFAKEQFDVLSHHAAQISVRVAVENPRLDAEINILGSLNLYEAARISGVKKIIFASSGGAVYGEQQYYPADEKHPKRPISPYGVTKLSNEFYLGYYRAIYGIEHVIFRYTNVYGPRQNPHGEAGVVAIFIQKMLAGEQPVINGDGTQTRDYIYVEDLVRANVLALENHAQGIFNCSTASEKSVNILFQILQYKTGNHCKRIHAPGKTGEQKRSVCSYDKAKTLLNWSPQVHFEEGLARTIEWFKSQKKK